MSSFQVIPICFYRSDYADNYYDRGADMFYQGIKFPKYSKYEGYKFYVGSMDIKTYDHCDVDDSNRSFNKEKMWVYLCHDAHVNIYNIETNEIKSVLTDEIKEEMHRDEYDSLKFVPRYILEQYGNNYDEIKKRFMPKYKLKQEVHFMMDGKVHEGVIFVVDTFGTLEQNIEPSYDLENAREKMIYKHIMQSNIISLLH